MLARDATAARDHTVASASRLLDADRFAAEAIEALAHRATYADAAVYLDWLARARARESVIDLLLTEGDPAFVPRVAVHFGLTRQHDLGKRRLTLEWIRSQIPDKPQALRALALAGEIDWPRASIEARAAYALRNLVFAMRRGAS